MMKAETLQARVLRSRDMEARVLIVSATETRVTMTWTRTRVSLTQLMLKHKLGTR